MSAQSSVFTTVYAVSRNKLLGGKKSPHRTVLYVTHCSEQAVASIRSFTATLSLALRCIPLLCPLSGLMAFNTTFFFLFVVPKPHGKLVMPPHQMTSWQKAWEMWEFVTRNKEIGKLDYEAADSARGGRTAHSSPDYDLPSFC
ncbi:hypothetical protein AMECASPLE_035778 [Ameca splendens]|uniref:Uncharacterized protein n=1 Tax=Ameca splendens TaxID=208324 RepID=A0ABV1ADW0_9TELE